MEIFTYDWLRELYKRMKEIALVVSVEGWNPSLGGYTIVLGHDIDFSIRKAYDLYLLEREMSIMSTFFVLTTTSCYNVLDPENRKRLREMSASGYEIGLHFDISVYEDRSLEYLEVEVDREAKILGEITGKSVTSVCLHNSGMAGIFPSFCGFRNVSDFWNKIPILVDSCMDFEGIDPFEFIERRARHETIALWLHPIHYGTVPGTYHESLSFDLSSLIGKVDSLARVNRTYRKQMGRSSLMQKVKERIL